MSNSIDNRDKNLLFLGGICAFETETNIEGLCNLLKNLMIGDCLTRFIGGNHRLLKIELLGKLFLGHLHRITAFDNLLGDADWDSLNLEDFRFGFKGALLGGFGAFLFGDFVLDIVLGTGGSGNLGWLLSGEDDRSPILMVVG